MVSLLLITRQHTPGQFYVGPDAHISCCWEFADIESHLRAGKMDALLFESTFSNSEDVLALPGASSCAVFHYDRWRNTINWPGEEVLPVHGLIHRWKAEIWSTLAEWTLRSQHTQGRDAEVSSWRRLIVGQSKSIAEVTRVIRVVAKRRATVLITGETGTGKECAAKAIHLASDRAPRQMISVNCASLPESLLEVEMFGHTKGAFTGANTARAGHFEQAHNSTLFFDEIGDISANTQVKLLRVLQEREIVRVGSSETVPVDIRLICATNQNLSEAVRNKAFREDLYYRLNVLPLRIPPLRERLDDIPVLVDHFIEKICKREELPAKSVSPDVLEWLAGYQWPGNIRELENAVEMAIAMSSDRKMLLESDFPLHRSADPLQKPGLDLPPEGLHYESFMVQLQRTLIEQAMRRARGNQTVAAGLLGMKRTTLISKYRALGSCA